MQAIGGCDACLVVMINRVRCHEVGCPDAWRDRTLECKWCGQPFQPETRWQQCCGEDCAEKLY